MSKRYYHSSKEGSPARKGKNYGRIARVEVERDCELFTGTHCLFRERLRNMPHIDLDGCDPSLGKSKTTDPNGSQSSTIEASTNTSRSSNKSRKPIAKRQYIEMQHSDIKPEQAAKTTTHRALASAAPEDHLNSLTSTEPNSSQPQSLFVADIMGFYPTSDRPQLGLPYNTQLSQSCDTIRALPNLAEQQRFQRNAALYGDTDAATHERTDTNEPNAAEEMEDDRVKDIVEGLEAMGLDQRRHIQEQLNAIE